MFTSSHSPSIISRRANLQVTIGLCVASWLTAHLCFWILPGLLKAWDTKVIDGMFLLRSASSYHQPPYNDTIVHVDINDSSLRQLHSFYLNRKHFAKAINNMAEMGIAAQLFDFIFAEKTDAAQDHALIDATGKAGNVYFGMAFNLNHNSTPLPSEQTTDRGIAYLEKTKWHIEVHGNPETLYDGTKPLMTFLDLAEKSKGLGFLNLHVDADGFSRRIPLLVRFQDAFYPSVALRCICDYRISDFGLRIADLRKHR